MESDSDDGIVSRRISAFEICLIVLILAASVACILWMTYRDHQKSSGPRRVLIYRANELMEEIELKKDRLLTLPAEAMQIEVKGGKIRIIESDCPKQTCVNMGWIKTPGQIIVCAPNKVVVEVTSGDPQLLDAVVY